MQLALNWDVTRSHHRGNPESAAAHRRVDKAQWQQRVLDLCKRPQGATADECAAFYAVGSNTVAPRLSELKCAGRVAELWHAGQRVKRETRAGCGAQVFVAKLTEHP